MSMKPKIQTREQRSQATPLAMETLEVLRSELMGGAFGAGIGPLSRQAGTAIQQFVASGGGRFDTSDLVQNLEEIHRRQLGENVAQLHESFGAMGGRFGRSAADAEAKLRAESTSRFQANIGELFRQEFANQQQRLLQGIGLMQQIGLQSIAPFLAMAQLGIHPEHLVVSDSPFKQITSGVSAVLKGVGAVASAL